MIKAGMTIAEIIGQLTRGFIKVMGRKPDGLEKIKIKQEAGQKFTDMNKVVDMEGNVIDATKPIVGGSQEASIKKNIAEATGKGDFKGIFNQVMRDPDIAKEFKRMKELEKLKRERDLTKKLIPDRDIIPYQSKEIQKMSPADKQKYLITNDKQTAELLKKGYTFDDIIYAQDNYGLTAKEIMQEAAGATKKDPFPFAEGGRIGFQGGGKDASKDDFGGGFNTGQGGGAQFSGSGGDISPGTDLGGGFRGAGGGGGKGDNPIVEGTKNAVKNIAINELSKKLGFAKFANPIGQLMAIKGLYDSIKNPTGTPNQFGFGDDDEDESKKEKGPESVSLGTGLAEQAKQAIIDRQAQIEEAAKALGMEYADGGRIGLKEGEGIMQLASVDSPFFSPEYADDHSFEMFGKPYKELNADELEQFKEEMDRLMNKFSSAPDPMDERNSMLENLSRQYFNKPLRNLSPKEIELLEEALEDLTGKKDRGAPSITLADGGRAAFKDGLLAKINTPFKIDRGTLRSMFFNKNNPIITGFNTSELFDLVTTLSSLPGLAEGGRIGYKDGPKDPGKRKFMKAALGIASMLPFGIGKGVKMAAPAITKAAEIAEPALAKLVETVMSTGKLISVTGKRVKEMVTKKKLGKVEVEEDIADSSYIIKKDGKEIYYKPGRMDESGGIDDSIIEVIEDTVTKKASGGIARMLGE